MQVDDFIVLPDIVVEAALDAAQPVSGAGTMTLDDASFGLLGTDFLAGANTWTDISEWVRGFTVNRPFTRVQGPLVQFQAGTASITLNNTDGRFDPDNLAGPYISNGIPPDQEALFNTGAGGVPGVTVTAANSGGDSGDKWDTVSIGTNASLTYDNTHLLHGQNTYKLSVGSTSTTVLTEWSTSEGTQSTVYFRMYLYLTANPSANIRPIAFRSGGSLACAIGVNTSGKIQLINGANAVQLSFTNGIPTNQWFRIEGYITGNATTGVMSCDLYTDVESNTVTESNTLTAQNTTGNLTQYWFGEQASVTNVGPFWYGGVGISHEGPLGPVITQIGAMVPIRISAVFDNVSYPVFHGFADSWQESDVTFASQVSDWTLNATDGFKILAGQNLGTIGSAGANEDSGARVNRILDAASWYTGIGGGARKVDTGDSDVQATTLGDTPLNLLQITSDSEIGQLYMDGSGAVVFRHRQALITDERSITPQAVFGDLPGHSSDNALVGQDSNFEGSIGNWVVNSNCTIAFDSSHQHTNAGSLSLTSVASGAMSAASCNASNIKTRGLLVEPKQTVFVSAWLKAATTAEQCEVGAQFYDAGGNFLSTVTGSNVLDNAAGWTEVTATLVASDKARYCRAWVQVSSTAGASEVHYLDDVSLTTPELPVAAISRMDDDLTIGNDIQATIVGGTLQEVTDSDSILKYLFPRTYERDDLILTSDADAAEWASWILYVSKSGENRFESITIDPQAQPGGLWPQVLGRDIGDRVTVKKRPSLGDGTYFVVSRDVFIAGISHTYDVGSSSWSTVFSFQDASKYGAFLTLDDDTLGKLDHNALAF